MFVGYFPVLCPFWLYSPHCGWLQNIFRWRFQDFFCTLAVNYCGRQDTPVINFTSTGPSASVYRVQGFGLELSLLILCETQNTSIQLIHFLFGYSLSVLFILFISQWSETRQSSTTIFLMCVRHVLTIMYVLCMLCLYSFLFINEYLYCYAFCIFSLVNWLVNACDKFTLWTAMHTHTYRRSGSSYQSTLKYFNIYTRFQSHTLSINLKIEMECKYKRK